MLQVLVDNVAARLPGVEVRLGFIELSSPLLTDVLPELKGRRKKSAISGYEKQTKRK